MFFVNQNAFRGLSVASSSVVHFPFLCSVWYRPIFYVASLIILSTRNHRCNSDPIVTKFLYRGSKFCVFFHCLVTQADVVGVQTLATLGSRSTRDQRSNCVPFDVVVFFYSVSQRCVFFRRPFIRTCGRGGGGVQILTPPVAGTL
jgi:hypothetical protein